MKKHRVLVIGVGSIGERHTRCFQQTGRADVGICELNPKLRQDVAQRYNLTRVFDNLDAAIRAGFDVAVIATPAQLHVPMAIKLVDAGLALLIEKPLATSLDGVDDLRQRVAQKNATASIGYTWRSMEHAGFLRDLVASGRFGRPLHASYIGGQHFPTFRPAYREIYYKDRKTGGGAIQDSITHLFNFVEWCVGAMTRICVDAAHLALEGVTVEDTVNAIARHGDVLASYTLTQHQHPNETTVTVICTGGTVRLVAHESKVMWMTTPNGPWEIKTFEPAERDTHYIRQANLFLDAVEGKRPVVCTLDEGIQTLKVNLAALRSADGGGWQDVR